MIRALVDRIVPGDAFPSASEAGVLTFLERLIAAEGLEGAYVRGLGAVDEASRVRYSRRFSDLTADEQDALLRHIEMTDTPAAVFFAMLAEETIDGYYSDPGNGANRGEIAWQMIGFRVTG